MSESPAPDARPSGSEVAAWRLTTTLAVAGMLAGLLIVTVHEWAMPRIEAHRAEVLQAAIGEVLHAPSRVDTLYVSGGALTDQPPPPGAADVDRVYAGYDATGHRIGFAIPGAEPGFQDVIRLIFGYDPVTKKVLGMRVLESRETPGLGAKIEQDSTFVAGFEGPEAPIEGVKAGAGRGDPHEVDMITGATISSRAVIGIVNHRLEAVGPLIDAWVKEGGR